MYILCGFFFGAEKNWSSLDSIMFCHSIVNPVKYNLISIWFSMKQIKINHEKCK